MGWFIFIFQFLIYVSPHNCNIDQMSAEFCTMQLQEAKKGTHKDSLSLENWGRHTDTFIAYMWNPVIMLLLFGMRPWPQFKGCYELRTENCDPCIINAPPIHVVWENLVAWFNFKVLEDLPTPNSPCQLLPISFIWILTKLSNTTQVVESTQLRVRLITSHSAHLSMDRHGTTEGSSGCWVEDDVYQMPAAMAERWYGAIPIQRPS